MKTKVSPELQARLDAMEPDARARLEAFIDRGWARHEASKRPPVRAERAKSRHLRIAPKS